MSQDPIAIKSIHHVEIWAGNAKQAAYFYRKGFGFSQLAYAGLETGLRDRTSYCLAENKVRLLLSTPLAGDGPMSEFLDRHGDGVRDLAGGAQDWVDAFTDREANIRVRMGGSWRVSAHACRCACRYGWPPDVVYPDLGFRLAMSL